MGIYINPTFKIKTFQQRRLGFINSRGEYEEDNTKLTIEFSISAHEYGYYADNQNMIFDIVGLTNIKADLYKVLDNGIVYSTNQLSNSTKITFTEKLRSTGNTIAIQFSNRNGSTFNEDELNSVFDKDISIIMYANDKKQPTAIFVGAPIYDEKMYQITQNDFYGSSNESYYINSGGYKVDSTKKNISTVSLFSKSNRICDHVDITYNALNYTMSVHCFDNEGNYLGNVSTPETVVQYSNTILKCHFVCIENTKWIKLTLTAKSGAITNGAFTNQITNVRIYEKKIVEKTCSISSWRNGCLNLYGNYYVHTNWHIESSGEIDIPDNTTPIITIDNSSNDVKFINIYTSANYDDGRIYDYQSIQINRGIFDITPSNFKKSEHDQIRLSVYFNSNSKLTASELVSKGLLTVTSNSDIGIAKKVSKIYVGDDNGNARLVYSIKAREPSVNSSLEFTRAEKIREQGCGYTRDYAIYTCGYYVSTDTPTHIIGDPGKTYVYDKNLSMRELSYPFVITDNRILNNASATDDRGENVIFAGAKYMKSGINITNTDYTAITNAFKYNNDLSITHLDGLSSSRCPGESAYFANYYIFAGGHISNSSYSKKIDLYDDDFTHTVLSSELDYGMVPNCAVLKDNYCFISNSDECETDNFRRAYYLDNDLTLNSFHLCYDLKQDTVASTKDHIIIQTYEESDDFNPTYYFHYYALDADRTKTSIPYFGDEIWCSTKTYSSDDYALFIGGHFRVFSTESNSKQIKIIDNELVTKYIDNGTGVAQSLVNVNRAKNKLLVEGEEANFIINI